jgi:hypothetical protein
MAKRHQPKWEKHGVKEQMFNRTSTELGQPEFQGFGT